MPYPQQIQALFNQLESVCLFDQYTLKQALLQLGKQQITPDILESITDKIHQAQAVYLQRIQALPSKIDYPDGLPVTAKKQDIARLIQSHQVVIIAGETGSGKTTQIPKICLELGLGVKGLIGHTQPRRLAARSVASRIAQELNSQLGTLVGYKVRFTDQVQPTTLIKLMTDGILLAEIQQDRLLRQYDTIIIDEAHERSLNIDFILGYLKQLLPKRPDLKVIITSATIDVERFSRHFNQAPIVEVSGRTYPVEVRYRPTHQSDDNDVDDFQGIIDAIDELSFEDNRGDILVFLTGEREIRDLADTLSKLNLLHTEIVPLYARLSAAEQNRIFQPHSGRRIILSTNVAETSLTVPGIKYVIDPGMARISRYSYRTKVQRLPIEPVSQASANQRKGRCGRTSDGICIRLYDEIDFLSRPEFTEPEILRTNLASVILQMTALDLGNIAAFPFLEPPEQKHIKDGIRLLEELGAIFSKKGSYHLTKIGQILSQLPIDPRLARMLFEARKTGCVKEIMIISAALSIQDPRERPLDKQQASDEKHKRFQDKNSDFMSYLNLWQYIDQQQNALTNNQFRQLCRKEFLNYLRIKEWQDIYSQIRQTVKQLNIAINSHDSDYPSIHRAILSGLLSHIGMKELEKFEYIGARNIKFAIFPGSGVFKTLPKWCVASELVETAKLWGRNVAKIEPEWIEPLAVHLSKKHYSEPRWSKKQGTTIANEKVTLFGLPIVNCRTVNYHRIDPQLSRELFIKQALIDGDFDTKYDFLIKNNQLVNEVEELEHKSRRQDILVDPQLLFEFYDRKIPTTVTCAKDFDHWWKKEKLANSDYLLLTKTILINPNAEQVTQDDYPDYWLYNNQIKLKITYQFDIGGARDGVTINIPLTILNQIDEESVFQWQVLGFRQELIIALIKSLPKSLRRHLVPAPNYAQAFLERCKPYSGDLFTALEREYRKMTGITITKEDWQRDLVPNYLLMTFAILDEQNQPILVGKDLSELKETLKDQVQKVLTQITQTRHNEIEKNQLTTWDFGHLPKVYEKKQQNYVVKAYPTLVDEGHSVSIKLVDNEDEQIKQMQQGIKRLIYLNIPSPIKYLHEKLPNKAKLGLYFNPFGKISDLIDDCIYCGIDYLIDKEQGIIFEQSQFQPLLVQIKAQINDIIVEIATLVERILTLNFAINKKLKGRMDLNLALSLADIKQQLSQLIYKGFVADSTYQKLPDIYRYLQAVDKRIEKLYLDPSKDRLHLHVIERVMKLYQTQANDKTKDKSTRQLRWMIEELRVNLFAQQLGTPYPISEKRINQFVEELSKG
ncbi:ATP-dependent helicase HrpA [Orbus hercynius]|uniref:RNA helicase n=1 Tax=Orbus hercynius TaxID=593135 RepID=A0A495RJ03_9GAMM|nr:ATP-dependent RNA helicase HrpA [Orbus hercynius]RKS87513.1 ATP-dependent helicase HrpA [Orbus hercynius]